MVDREKKLAEKTMEFEAMKMESDATISSLTEANQEFKTSQERLQEVAESLEKERDELRASLQEKMDESLRLEESLRGSLLHKSKNIKIKQQQVIEQPHDPM